MDRKKISEHRDEELQSVAPGLGDLSREDGFTVPHNYFRELPDRVMDRIRSSEQSQVSFPGWIRLWLRPRYALAIASVVILTGAAIWIWQVPHTSQSNALAKVSSEEAMQYVLSNLYEFAQEDLLATGFTEELNTEILLPETDEGVHIYFDEFLDETDIRYFEEMIPN